MHDGLHSGHRERLINKFIEYPESFSEHELLEVFLFSVVPRKDTNETAHRLLQAFGSVAKVFSATAEQLTSVKGVGKTIAAQIVLSGKIMQKIASAKKSEDNKSFSSFDTIKNEVISMFDGVKAEKFYFILLNESFKKVFSLDYVGNSDEEVFADTADIARAMSVHKAKYAIMAHNHPSGSVNPSNADDKATKKFCVICDLYGVKLVDHVIVADKNVYSYFGEKRLEYIKETIKQDKIL